MKADWKKDEKRYYSPPTRPERIRVPAFNYFAVSGSGDPNREAFAEYMQVLYSLAYAVRMAPKAGNEAAGYREFTVYPLEGVWDLASAPDPAQPVDKSRFVFDLMIRQPDFVTASYAADIVAHVGRKKPQRLLAEVRFETIEQGEFLQMMHIGPFDAEPASFAEMERFCAANGISRTTTSHREIYLSDPRRTSPEKLRTVLRYPVRPVDCSGS